MDLITYIDADSHEYWFELLENYLTIYKILLIPYTPYPRELDGLLVARAL